MISFIKKWIEKRKEQKRLLNETCDRLITNIKQINEENKALFVCETEYIEPVCGMIWEEKAAELSNLIHGTPLHALRKTENFSKLCSMLFDLGKLIQTNQHRVRCHNNAVAQKQIQAAYELIGNVEGRKLDAQQMGCIVKKAHSHLVIAGAGTGKTTTVVGKIKYLLKTKQCGPGDILVLSFTNASAAEMNQRIYAETGEQIAASTFHKLGLNIITKVNNRVPKITQLNLRKFVKEKLQSNMRSEAYLTLLSEYLLCHRAHAKSEFEFNNQEEYQEYLILNPPATIKNETVKSYGEMDIANFLARNGIAYIYEYPYEYDTRTSEFGQYHPDFYLPEYKIYIEYFGVNRQGEAPSYFSGKNGMNATQSYQESMRWKRNLHAEKNTVLVECFAYEKMEGSLQDHLEQSLAAHGVKFKPMSPKELWSYVTAEEEVVLDGLIELFETVVNLIKSNGYTIDEVRKKNVANSNRAANDLLLSLIEPIYNAYLRYLQINQEIDFNDMINMATQYVSQGRFHNPYRYVIVDEYQDISKSRYRLLKELRNSRDYELFCVGDDWQSIYRFAGSDIGFILNFSDYWGASEESKIETTYRFTESLVAVSGKFIMMNPAQKKKMIQGKASGGTFALSEIQGYTEKNAVEFLAQKIEDLPQDSTVFFIGRYLIDANILKDSGLFEMQYNNQTGLVDVRYRKRADLTMRFTTAHKSKGLQADYVIILNNKRTRMGFPSKIQDAPILDLLLESCDDYPFAEERRLFYVALTRARKKAILLTLKDRESVFAMELKECYTNQLQKERFECPLCGGRLIKRSGKFGEFLGCSNYTNNGCKYTRNIRRIVPQ